MLTLFATLRRLIRVTVCCHPTCVLTFFSVHYASRWDQNKKEPCKTQTYYLLLSITRIKGRRDIKPFHIAGWSFTGLGLECTWVPGLWSFCQPYIPFLYVSQAEEQGSLSLILVSVSSFWKMAYTVWTCIRLSTLTASFHSFCVTNHSTSIARLWLLMHWCLSHQGYHTINSGVRLLGIPHPSL